MVRHDALADLLVVVDCTCAGVRKQGLTRAGRTMKKMKSTHHSEVRTRRFSLSDHAAAWILNSARSWLIEWGLLAMMS